MNVVWSHGNDRITFDDETNRYQFIMDDRVKVEITDTLVRVFDRSGNEIFGVNQLGGMHILYDRFEMDKPGTDDYILRVGTGLPGDVRGRVEIHQQPEQGRVGDEFYMPKKAGILVLYDERGDDHFLWVDSNGKLRISSSDPGTNDLSDTVVGTQS